MSGLFKKWLQSERFGTYLENQVSDSTYTTGFVNALLLFFAYLSSRDKIDSEGNIQVIKDGVDTQLVANKYLGLLTKLHNSSPRAKKLFPIRPLLAPITLDQPIEENKEAEPIVEVVPEDSALEIKEPVQEDEVVDVESVEETEPTANPLPEENPSEISESVQEDEVVNSVEEPVQETEVIDVESEPTISEIVEEFQSAEPEKNQKPSKGKKQ